MRIHSLEHVPYEGLAHIGNWLRENGHSITTTRFYEDWQLPALDKFDLLIIMGGPMSVHDEDELPWLKPEKTFIKAAVQAGKRALGICLGGQHLALALGGEVFVGPEKEIGWHALQRCPGTSAWHAELPETFTTFHWHGEQFSLPPGSQRLATTSVCENQGFIWADRVVALQFHLEMTSTAVAGLVAACGDELSAGTRFVQSAADILDDRAHFAQNQQVLTAFLRILTTP